MLDPPLPSRRLLLPFIVLAGLLLTGYAGLCCLIQQLPALPYVGSLQLPLPPYALALLVLGLCLGHLTLPTGSFGQALCTLPLVLVLAALALALALLPLWLLDEDYPADLPALLDTLRTFLPLVWALAVGLGSFRLRRLGLFSPAP